MLKNIFTALSIALVTTTALVTYVHAEDANVTKLINPLEKTVSQDAPIQSLSGIFINTLFGIAGSIALAMFVWGGALWLTSMGNEKQVAKGKAIFQWTTLGVIMMFAAYTLVNFLFSNLGNPAASAPAAGGGGAGSGGGSSTDVTYCCVDAGAYTASNVTGASKAEAEKKCMTNNDRGLATNPGPCSSMQFCSAEFTAGVMCGPVLSGSCSGKAYNSYKECLIVEVPKK